MCRESKAVRTFSRNSSILVWTGFPNGSLEAESARAVILVDGVPTLATIGSQTIAKIQTNGMMSEEKLIYVGPKNASKRDILAERPNWAVGPKLNLPSHLPNFCKLIQYICRLDPRAVNDDVADTPLEIAASNKNSKAFDLLSIHYEENTKKKIAQLMIWGLTDDVPNAAFMQLFASVPLAEVGFE